MSVGERPLFSIGTLLAERKILIFGTASQVFRQQRSSFKDNKDVLNRKNSLYDCVRLARKRKAKKLLVCVQGSILREGNHDTPTDKQGD